MLVWSDGRQVTIRRNMIFEVQWRGFPVPLPFRPISEKSNDVTSVVFALAFRPRPPVAIGDTAFPRTDDGRKEGRIYEENWETFSWCRLFVPPLAPLLGWERAKGCSAYRLWRSYPLGKNIMERIYGSQLSTIWILRKGLFICRLWTISRLLFKRHVLHWISRSI